MSTPSNVVPASPPAPPVLRSPAQPMYWCVVRELWENRSIYIAPLAAAAVMLLGFLIATLGRALSTPDLALRREVLEEPYRFAAGLIMAAAFFVGIFYCLDALHGERRDRSILFWKSLPVSDLTVVLSKASIPLLVLPVLTFVLIVTTQMIMLALSSAVLAGSGLSVAPLWTHVSFFQMSVMLLYHLVTVHALWHAPFYAWLLLVSGWARRATFLWAALPPAALAVFEKVAFHTSHFADLLLYRLTGPEPFPSPTHGAEFTYPWATLEPAKFLSTPGLWIGLTVAAALLAAAARQRRYRAPI